MLTDKQEAFCRQYIIDLNASKAAVRAGYSERTAGAIGSENLTKPEIQARITELREEAMKRAELTADMIIEELRSLGFWNIQDFLNQDNSITDLVDLPRDTTRPIVGIKVKQSFIPQEDSEPIREVTTELKLVDKRGALVDLGKHLGIFKADNEQKGETIVVTRKK